MRFRDWVRRRGKGTIAFVARETGLSYQYIHALASSQKLVALYATAKRISDFTNGVVSIAELCERPRRRRSRKRTTTAAAA